ncbi:MAG: hypothetical protein ACI3YI_10025 [Bacteroidaceae bacterium]
MKQYIDKATIVAEIDRRIDGNKDDIQRANNKHLEEYFEGYEDALVLFKEKFLNTLEVKDVNLDKEARNYLLYEHGSPLFRILHEIDLLIEMQYHRDIENAFKAGFELCIQKAQKGE